ncbi:MAG: SAVED domain-containing protein [Pyrinomonadaceae bacterium]
MPTIPTNKKAKPPFTSKTPRTPVKDVTRQVDPKVKLQLFVLAGGRCQFDGCPHYLIEHHLTHKRGIFAQMAHIVAFSKKGPRGNVLDRPEDINNVDNLMLLCPTCHKLIDDNPEEHPREQLEAFKKDNEERIFRLTAMAPDRKTTVVIITAKIGGQAVKISQAEINEAIAPRHAASRGGRHIDLSTFDDDSPQFFELAEKKIRKELSEVFESTLTEDGTNHISLFVLGPMPLLILAGNILGDKVACDLYQKHRDTQDWVWKDDGEPVRYRVDRMLEGKDKGKVALVLSLSGKIEIARLPPDVIDAATIYELTLHGRLPEPGFLRTREDLEAFRDTYQKVLRQIGVDHGRLEHLHIFPAAPAPVCVQFGRGLMPKHDPILVVYDDDKRHGGFTKILEVNK